MRTLTSSSSPATATTLPAAEAAPASLLGAFLDGVGRRLAVVVGDDLGDVALRVEVHDHPVGPVALDEHLVARVRAGPLELHRPAGVTHRHHTADAVDRPGVGLGDGDGL